MDNLASLAIKSLQTKPSLFILTHIDKNKRKKTDFISVLHLIVRFFRKFSFAAFYFLTSKGGKR